MDDRPTGDDRLEEARPEDHQPETGDPDDLDPGGDGPDFDLPVNMSREGGVPRENEFSERSGTMTVIVIGAVTLLGAAAVLWWWFSSRGTGGDSGAGAQAAAVDTETAGSAADPAPTAEPPGPAPEPPPDLEGSDSLVRDVVGALSRHAEWAVWLVPEELVMNFVRAVGAVAYDEPPQGSLEPLRPEDGFSVVRRGQRFYPAETSYRRYDLAVEVFDSIDLAGVADAYTRLEPLFERAHDELGYPGEFGDTLERAVTRLLLTPTPESPPELRLRVISFEYVDPELESLNPAQKLLLRLGPENGDRVRAKVRELYGALE